MSSGPGSQPKIRQLFGTDGIRGVAGKFPLDSATIVSIGAALGKRITAKSAAPRVMVGMDTRESSSWIARALATGLDSQKVQVVSAGVITTPAVAFLTRTQHYDAGIVISASHNPWQDNGIKVFGHDGFKLSDDVEHAIEQEIFAHIDQAEAAGVDGNSVVLSENPGLHSTYVEWLASHIAQGSLSGLRVLVDCANGATSPLAPELFATLGISAKFMNVAPDGHNINANCGALHPEIVAQVIAESSASNGAFDIGVSFDGDGDRALFADDAGSVINGDAVLLLMARDMQARGALPGNTVVATTMSNMGLEAALRRSGISMLRAPVGDKYVLEEMKKTGVTLGGEQSGHVIFLDGESTTGDGLLTALRVFQVMSTSKRPLADLVADLHVFPQVIKNIKVREKRPFAELPAVADAIEAAEQELGEEGRVVVRYSGTEALARVMVEAASSEQMQRVADAIAGMIQRELGV